MSDLLERAKQMPSSLNDACRTIELMGAEIERLREQLETGRSSFGEAMKENDKLREQLASAREVLNEIFRYSHDHHIYERALRARNKIDAALTDDQQRTGDDK